MTTLKERTIVVLGASGNVGHGVASAALEAGAKVILPCRTEASAAAVAADFRGKDAQVVVGDVSDGADADRLASVIAAHGPITDVVASIGAWWSGGRLTEQTSATWTEVRAMLLDGHVHAARTLLPQVEARGGHYVILTGTGAVRPIPGASLLTIALGGTLALSRLLRAETGGAHVNEVRIASRVERRARPGLVVAHAFGQSLTKLLVSDVHGAIVPFTTPEAFDVAQRIAEPR